MLRRLVSIRTLSFAVFLSLCGAVYTHASQDDLPPDEHIAHLNQEAAAVVRIKITGTTAKKNGIYVEQMIEGTVVTSYKGQFKVGQKLRYFVLSEAGLEMSASERIVFLGMNKTKKEPQLFALEAGQFKFDEALAEKIKS